MDISNSSLYNEVKLITEGGDKSISYFWKAEIHVNGETHAAYKVMNVDNVRDYQKNIADEATVSLMIPLGLWAKVIYPARAEMEISLFKVPMFETSGGDDKDSIIESQRYAASPVLDGLIIPQGKDIDKLSQDTLDLRDLPIISFQLFSKTLEKLRMVTVGGLYRNCTGHSVIQALLATESSKVTVDTGDAVTAIDIVPPNNTTKRDHVVIPHGTRLIDVPGYVQDACGGVYNCGINAYMQDRIWYVYPLYDTTRLSKAKKTLTIIKVPKTMLSGVERTFRVEGDSLFILGTSDSSFDDDAGTNYLNYGNGVRYSDADAFMSGIVETKDNKAVAKRAKINSEYVAVEKANKNNVQMSDRRINANPYRESSKLSAITGGTYQFVWENSDPSLLFPGMMVRVLFLNNDEVQELHGALMFVQSATTLAGPNMQAVRHRTNSGLVVYVNKPEVI